MKKIYLLILFSIGFLFVAFGQTHSLSGRIISSDDNLGMPGVSVLIKGTTHGTVTDIDGNYTLKDVKPSDTIQFSFVGFTQQEMVAGNRLTLDITMVATAKEIEGVVVTALGIKREKREIGYTMQSFKGDELDISNTDNFAEALSGRSAGVNITTPNGVDGSTTRITIRGNNNITADNQPLIVVDGVPLQNEPGLTSIGRGIDWGSAINNINQADIENMSVLKGPTASALYGSKGANGVILITMKRGSKHKGLGVNYSYTYKLIHPYRYREVQNKYGAGGPVSLSQPEFTTDSTGRYIYPYSTHSDNGPFGMSTSELFGYYGTAVSWGPEMLGQDVLWWDGRMRKYAPQPDNQKLFFRDGNTQTHNLSFSGAGEMGSMRLSLTRTDNSAIIPNSKYDQTTINLGSRMNISDKIHADLSASYINYNRENSPMIGEDRNSLSKGLIYCYPRSWKGIELENYALPDGSQNQWSGEGQHYPFEYISPYIAWELHNNNTTLGRNKLLGAFTLIYDATPWLNVLGRLGLDFTLNQFETRNNPTDVMGLVDGYYENELGRDIVNNNDFLITAHKENILGSKVGVKFSIGGTQWKRRLYGLKGKSGTWTNPWLFAMLNYSDANQITYPNTNDGNRREYRYEKNINSLYSFLNLNYSNFLFLQLTGRNDWSSALPASDNSYFYPSVSLSFIPTELFDFHAPWFNFWKLRGAVAGTATDTDPYQLDFVYTLGNFNGSQNAFLPDTIPPISLQPQTANSYEAGTTVGLLKNRLNIDFTYYYIKSSNQIIESPVPLSSGAYAVTINNGILENKGWELILSGVILESHKFVFESGLNFSRNRNYVVSLGKGAESIELADIWGLNGPAIVVREGEEYGTIVGYDYIYDKNGQPIISDDGTTYKFTDTRVPIGNASPDFLAGWWTSFSFKGFTLRTLVDTKWGGEIYCGSYVTGLQTGQSPETLLERDGGGLPYTDPDGVTRNIGVILPGVYEDGSPNDKVVHYYFKYLPNAGGWGHFLSKPGIIEDTWVKTREISLIYRFPQKLIQKTRVFQDLSLSIVGRDLFYIYTTVPDKINPEGLNGSGNAQGLEWASLPGVRSFSFGINASF